jgi:hypothetical protein
VKNLDVVQILRLGAIGLGFLLSFMAYRLLTKEQATDQPRESILGGIKTYMGFAIVLVVLATAGELTRTLAARGDAREKADPDPACASLDGMWLRPYDSFQIRFVQRGCQAEGYSASDSETNSHQVHIALAGNTGLGFVRRVYKGCVKYLSSQVSVENQDAIRIEGHGSGCDLKDYREDFPYQRIKN